MPCPFYSQTIRMDTKERKIFMFGNTAMLRMVAFPKMGKNSTGLGANA